jgi:hypothetical protein
MGGGRGGMGMPGRPGMGGVDFLDPSRIKKEGKALLSWRVSLLPFLGEMGLYQQFKLDEPWDSPHNRRLLRKMPRVYAPPGVATREPFTTFYQAFVGPHAAFEKHRALPLVSFLDGTSNTLLLAEAGAPVPWTKPEDLHFAPDEPLPELGGLFPGIFHAALADGSVWTFVTNAPAETLRDAIMRDDGKPVDLDSLRAPSSRREAALRQQNRQIQQELKREAARIEELRREKQLLEEMAGDTETQRVRRQNESLQKELRDLREETAKLREEIRRLKKTTEKP